jgi:ATP-dependent exoDNAse (exonuclease V) alpha subunit
VVKVTQKRIWNVPSNVTKDSLGILPLFHGMRVMITENLATDNKLVNGMEGIVQHIDYGILDNGGRYAKACYVLVKGSDVKVDGYDIDVVPILPVPHSFTYKSRYGESFPISRLQLPLVPAYSYTDYKSQGRTLERAIVDLKSARSLQGIYVMLSRVKSLAGLAVLGDFPPNILEQHLSEELRNEFKRLDEQTLAAYGSLLRDEDALLLNEDDAMEF